MATRQVNRLCENCGTPFTVRYPAEPQRFCSHKCIIHPSRPAKERYWEKVNKNGPVPERRPDLGPCWLWTAGLNGNGYGQFHDAKPPTESTLAHRRSYTRLVGPVPEGLELDHLCRVRHCVNPSHLEPVTGRTNKLRGNGYGARAARKTHCPQGHRLAGANLREYGLKRGFRLCRLCHRDRENARYHRKKAGSG